MLGDDEGSDGDLPVERTSSTGASGGRRVLFRLTAVLLPFVALLLVELGLRAFGSGEADPYINVSPFSLFTEVEIDGEPGYRITHRFAYAERNTVFRAKKPDGGIRIFALGGSACASWPHPVGETFDAYLEQALANADPERPVEVINAAAHGFASYRVRRVFDEVIDLDPDAVVIYSGNNEFLESREYDDSVLSWADSLARHSRVVLWLRSWITDPRAELSGDELKDAAEFFWKKVQREALELRADPEKFERVRAHYAESIEYMVREAGRRGVRVVLVTVPVNLRDWLPAVSHNPLEGEQRQEWEALYRAGQRGDLAAFGRAIDMAPEHAESHFWLGRLQEAEGNTAEALESYLRAKDLDYNPFRAHSEFNRSLREIASRNEHALLADAEHAYSRAAEKGSPGFDLFLDYVHPNKRGNLLLAETVFDALGGSSFARSDVPLPSGAMYDEKSDMQLQSRLYGLYAMNHQYAAAVEQARYLVLLETGEDVGDADELPATLHPNLTEGYRAFRLHEKLRRKELLGEPVAATEKERADRLMKAFYEKWFSYGSF